MTFPQQPNQSELDRTEILRRRAAEMHLAVDNWLELTAFELGIPLPPLVIPPLKSSIGISFEPGVSFTQVPGDSAELQTGFYSTRAGREVEVIPSREPGQVFFEIVDSQGQAIECSLPEELFHMLFVTCDSERPEQKVRYGLHPIYKSIALRYNLDGSITRGRFGERGEFVADVE